VGCSGVQVADAAEDKLTLREWLHKEAQNSATLWDNSREHPILQQRDGVGVQHV